MMEPRILLKQYMRVGEAEESYDHLFQLKDGSSRHGSIFEVNEEFVRFWHDANPFGSIDSRTRIATTDDIDSLEIVEEVIAIDSIDLTSLEYWSETEKAWKQFLSDSDCN